VIPHYYILPFHPSELVNGKVKVSLRTLTTCRYLCHSIGGGKVALGSIRFEAGLFSSFALVVAAAGGEGERSEPERLAAATIGAAPSDQKMV
jgi:hypothetical protein